ncbi:hypothetical protein MRX96_030371 [Rhipicephalus microplus]
MAACGIIWFRLLVVGRRCLHHIPPSLPAKRLLNSVTISGLQRAWRHDHKDLLLGVSDDRLASTCRWLLDKNVELKALRWYPAILKVSVITLQRRMAVIQKEEKSAELSSEAVLTLLSCPESLLSTVSDNGGVCPTLKARVNLLRQELGLSKRESLAMISRVPCLLSHELELAQRKLAILKQSGISKEALLKDPWVFRLQRGADSPPRGTVRALGTHPDTPDYLAKRLDCTSLEELVRRHPRLLSIRPPKLKEVLDLLFQSGYTAEQVRQYPRVLSASASRLRLRLQRIAAREAPLPSLYALLLPEKVFERSCGRFFDGYPRKSAQSRPPECQMEE